MQVYYLLVQMNLKPKFKINSGSKTIDIVQEAGSNATTISPPVANTVASGLPTSVSTSVVSPVSNAVTNNISKVATRLAENTTLQDQGKFS